MAVLDSGVALDAALHYDAINDAEGTEDSFDHGTKVANILLDNFPKHTQAELYDFKVLDARGRGAVESVCRGLEKAREFKVEVAVMSLGFHEEPPGLKSCIDAAVAEQILVVAAVGDNLSTQ